MKQWTTIKNVKRLKDGEYYNYLVNATQLAQLMPYLDENNNIRTDKNTLQAVVEFFARYHVTVACANDTIILK